MTTDEEESMAALIGKIIHDSNDDKSLNEAVEKLENWIKSLTIKYYKSGLDCDDCSNCEHDIGYLRDVMTYLEGLAYYTDGTGGPGKDILEKMAQHVAETSDLSNGDICYIISTISGYGRIACGAASRIFEGLVKAMEW